MPPISITSTPEGSGANGKIKIVITSKKAVDVDVDVSIKAPTYTFTAGNPAEDDVFGSGAAAWRNRKITVAAPLQLEYGWSTSWDRKTPYFIVVRVSGKDTFYTHWGELGKDSSAIQPFGEEAKAKLASWWLDTMHQIDPKILEGLLEKSLPKPPRGERPPREER